RDCALRADATRGPARVRCATASGKQRLRSGTRRLLNRQSLSKMLLYPTEEELMATTRTPGITVLADGCRFIDKWFLGVRIGLRIGAVTQDQAENRLQTELARVQCD